MRRLFSSVLLFAFLFVYTKCYAFAENFHILPANTPITIQTDKTYSSFDTKVGDTLTFNVVNNVTINKEVIIPAGSEVSATVKKAKARSRIGKPGELIISDFYTTSTKGIKIPLTGEITEKAKSKMALSITLSAVIIPFFLLMHGKDIQINQGTQYTLFTTSNINL